MQGLDMAFHTVLLLLFCRLAWQRTNLGFALDNEGVELPLNAAGFVRLRTDFPAAENRRKMVSEQKSEVWNPSPEYLIQRFTFHK